MGINYRGEIIIKKFRKIITEFKDDFYSAKVENLCKVCGLINFFVIMGLMLFFYMIGGVFIFVFDLKALGIAICALSIIYAISSLFFQKIFELTEYPTFKILQHLLRYGKVVTKKDWKNVKKYYKRLYKDLTSKKSYGFCYFYSRALALYLEDAQLMYCAILVEGRPSGHSVIVKNNCIYDTNDKKHYEYDEYIKDNYVLIYKMFSRDEYEKESFFDDIRQGFVEWCKENNAYCDPE